MNLRLLLLVMVILVSVITGVLIGTLREARHEVLTEHAAQLMSEKKYREALFFLGEALRVRPGYAEAHHLCGIAHGFLGNLREAEAHLSSAVLHDPRNPEARYNLARLLETMNDYRGALRQYREALQINPGYTNAIKARAHTEYLLARKFLEQGDAGQAAQHCRRAVELDMDHAEARYVLARLMLNKGAYRKAIDELLRIQEIEPRADIDHVLSKAHMLLGDAQESTGALGKAIDNYSRAIELQPDNTALRLRLGILLAKENHFEDASRELFKAIEEGAPSPGETGLAEDAKNAAQSLMKVGKLDAATSMLKLASLLCNSIDLSREEARLAYLKGKQAMKRGEVSVALPLFTRAEQSGVEIPGLLTELAELSFAMGQIEEASGYYEKLVAENPDNRDYLMRLGELYILQSRFDEADRFFARCGEQGKGKRVTLFQQRADTAEENGDWQEAVSLYQHARSLAPENDEMLLPLYLALGKAGRHEEALEGLQKLMDACPRPELPSFRLLRVASLNNVLPGEGFTDCEGHYQWQFSPFWEESCILGRVLFRNNEWKFQGGNTSTREKPSVMRISFEGPDPIEIPFSLRLRFNKEEYLEILFPPLNPMTSLYADRDGYTYRDGSLQDIVRTSFPEKLPEYCALHHARGMIYRDAGKKKEALESARYHLKWGEAYLRLNMYVNCRTELQRALDIVPGYFEAYKTLGYCRREEGVYHEALTAVDKALELKPRDSVALNNRGVLCAETGRLEAAERSLLQAVESDVNNIIACENLATLYELMGRNEDSLFWQEQAVRPRRVDPCEEGMSIRGGER